LLVDGPAVGGPNDIGLTAGRVSSGGPANGGLATSGTIDGRPISGPAGGSDLPSMDRGLVQSEEDTQIASEEARNTN